MSEDTGDAEDWQRRAEAAEAALSRVQADAQPRLVRAELKAEAVRAGMVDLDGLQLLNLADVKLSEAGDLLDGPALFAKLKRTKPWLFGVPQSSSAAASAPRPEVLRVRHANEMSQEEWQAARAALIRRR
jgi:hypothetical protein